MVPALGSNDGFHPRTNPTPTYPTFDEKHGQTTNTSRVKAK